MSAASAGRRPRHPGAPDSVRDRGAESAPGFRAAAGTVAGLATSALAGCGARESGSRGLLSDGRAVWLSSRADSVCAYRSSPDARAPSGLRGSLVAARRGEIVSTRVREGSVGLVSILPDGVRRVTIVPASGRPFRVPVARNAVARNAVVRTLDDPPRQLRFRLPGTGTGSTTVRDF